ncbi:MAG: HAD-IIA family hydrolase [Anaerolineales bacterium]|nr:HAD-IIA family hydrolase [Anaerolineales bacterium]MCX7609675.1 HAD-IIA family hydrolase [Anaerolineales bacterium]
MIPPYIQGLILDMDGVLWRGDTPIGDLPSIFNRLRERNLKFAFATNNGIRTPEMYVERLASFGVQVEPWQVVTSALAVADLLAKRFPNGGPVFAIGETGVMEALRQRGFEPLPLERAQEAQAVVFGIDRQITFQKMAEAALLVRRGLPFYATNPDKTFPTPRGEIPGAGAWVSVLVTASGVEPIFAGKPAPTLLEIACQRLGTPPGQTLVVGDRVETDIAAGQAAGMPCALVLSGVSTREQGETWRPKIELIAEDLESLVG